MLNTMPAELGRTQYCHGNPQFPVGSPALSTENITLSAQDEANIQTSIKFAKTKTCMVDQQRRLREMQDFILLKYPGYYRRCVWPLSEEEIADEAKFYFDKYTFEFIYEKLDPSVILAFLAEKKIKKL